MRVARAATRARAGGGCANASGSGAVLSASGSRSVAAGDLLLDAFGAIPDRPALLFQADETINGGHGVPFGNGLRCVGGSLVRLESVIADEAGRIVSTVPIAEGGRAFPGDVKYYHLWYRTPSGLPCGSPFNMSNAVEVIRAP